MPEEAKEVTSQPSDFDADRRNVLLSGVSLLALSVVTGSQAQAQPAPVAATAAPKPTANSGAKPNIVVIMGDDIGWFNIGAYHQGIMAGRTPNLDRLAAEGMRFTDYYAEASCTAGRANFITGELPDPHRPDHGRPGRVADRHAGAGADHRDGAQVDGLRDRPVRQESPGRSATSSCRPSTASTSSSATSITSTRWRTRPIRNYPPDCSRTRSARATCSTAGRPTSTIRPISHAGARSASRRSRTPGRSIRSG